MRGAFPKADPACGKPWLDIALCLPEPHTVRSKLDAWKIKETDFVEAYRPLPTRRAGSTQAPGHVLRDWLPSDALLTADMLRRAYYEGLPRSAAALERACSTATADTGSVADAAGNPSIDWEAAAERLRELSRGIAGAGKVRAPAGGRCVRM